MDHEALDNPPDPPPVAPSPQADAMPGERAAALAEDIARELGETEWFAMRTIRRLLRRRGEPFVRELVAKAHEIENAGGLFLEDLGRKRTLGGVFFLLCKQALGPEEWRKVHPYAPRTPKPKAAGAADASPQAPPPAAKAPTPRKAPAPPTPKGAPVRAALVSDKLQPPSPEEARAAAAVASAAKHLGEARTVKVTLIGRPGHVEKRPTCVVTAMEHKKTPSLPKGLPALPSTPTRYAVFISNKHWAKVESALAQHPDDELIVEGFAAFMPELGGMGVFAANATTVLLQRANKPAQPETS